ncbi:MAG: alpha-2-macroglobulin family protein [Saprospiraceae bacterium]
MRKHLALATLALFSLSVFTFSNCKKVLKNEAYFAAVSQYIYAYTSGAIGRADVVRVRFVNAAVGSEQIGQKVPADIFSVEPKMPGDAIWADDRTIELKPAEPLPFGKNYAAKVALSKLYPDVPKEAKVFEFEFSVRELSLEMHVEGIRAEDLNDLKKQQVVGFVRTSDAVDNASLEKTLSTQQGNKSLTINWSHSDGGRMHSFVVTGVERGNVRSKVNLAWSGAAVGSKAEGKEEVVVPALDEFVVLTARVEQTEEQYVVLNFSDPILATQTLDGLIRIDGFDGTLRFTVDGNFVRVYPGGRVTGSHNVRVEPGIKNTAGAAMPARSDWNLSFEDLKPEVRLVGRGCIVPKNEAGRVIFPFEAVGLNAVDVEVFKIYQSNILQFLQVNELEGQQELERVGKIILQKKVSLAQLNPNANARVWQRYAIDLQDIISQDPSAIYQVRLAFRKGYTDYTCTAGGGQQTADGEETGDGKEGGPNPPSTDDRRPSTDDDDALAHLGQMDEETGMLTSIMGGYRGIYWSDNWNEGGRYNWENRDNPCAKEYYNRDHFASRNVFVSDLGLTVKRGRDGSAFVAVTDLLTTEAVSGVNLEFYNYQLQPILKTSTDGTGTMRVENFREAPFVVVATRGERRGYLRMADGNSLSLSRFDVAGVEAQKGLKGYLYGERGVWRPGDSLFLDFVLEDLSGKLPTGHPVTFELTDPKGALQARFVTSKSVGGVYPMHTATRPDAPTGNWTAKILVGGATFTEQLKIETVKPNRLRMNLDFGRKTLGAGDENLTGKLTSTWLHGAVARSLKAKVEMQLRPGKTDFPNFKDFVFADPARAFSSEPQVIFDGQLDGNGQANVPLKLNTQTPAPGKLIAAFKTRVFEQGGDFSTDNFALDYFPYDAFVGISIPTDRWGNKEVDRTKGSDVRFACVDKNGNPLANKKLEVGLYRCDWRWWWDTDGYDNVAQFNSATHVNALDRTTLTTNAKGEAVWKVKPSDWGRYLIRVTDAAIVENGHSAGDFFWAGYPDNLDDTRSRNAAAMLPFSADKTQYAVGEEVTLKVPASENGRVLVTLETGSRVIDHFWRECKAGDNLLKFRTEEAMTPTVYAHVSLFQPHAQTKNDLPIRMYGVLPISVENPSSHLEPQIAMPDVLKPGDNFTVAVSEKSGKACAYTIALVDEGLLDLTRFKTPNPWDAFYAREALGVKTWDVYDYVLGAYGAELERIFAIGGDEFNQKAKAGAQVSRFKPAVRHIGPFLLEKGKTAKHSLKIENYVGSVRAMVVCSAPKPGAKGAYGMAEKTCPVRQALMVQPTLPRVLGPGETLRLPVNVFAMENKVKNAAVSVSEKSGLVSVSGGSKSLNFSQPGEQMAYFDLKVGSKTGAAKFKISASGGGETASEDIEILIRNPNPPVTSVVEGIIEPGQTWEQNVNVSQFTDIQSAVVEVSSIPPLNLSKQLDYLIQYPHGCVEQTTSSAFPQLFVDLITPLTPAQQADVQQNVSAAIAKLQNFQTASGGFGYWPGDYSPDDWSSSYAGHFLLEAKNKGFAVPQQMLDRWLDYQTKTSRTWDAQTSNDPRDWRYHDSEMSQAYRSYTLALAGKPDLGSMNRLREKATIYDGSASLLAAAYAMSGKAEVARELLDKQTVRRWQYDWYGHTYGSDLRELALRLETWTAIGDQNRASQLALQVAQQIGRTERNGWFSTQELATCLRAISKYAQKNGFGEKASFALKTGRGGSQNVLADKPIYTQNFTENVAGGVSVRNTGKGKLYARVILTGAPVIGNQAVVSNNLALAVRYTDLKGNPVDVGKLAQGTDFVAEVTVTRTGDMWFDFNELALTQTFPSGWEITNARMNGVASGASDPLDYQDIRDDRVLTYFDLPAQWAQNQPKKRTYRVQLTAAYAGKYYLPTVGCEAMYDNRISAAVPGRWVEII